MMKRNFVTCQKGFAYILVLLLSVQINGWAQPIATMSSERLSLRKTESGENEENRLRRVEIGLRYMPTFMGMNFRTHNGEIVRSSVTLSHGGAFVLGINVSRHLAIQGEVNYYKSLQKFKENEVAHEVNLAYVNVPLLLSLNTNKSSRFNVNLVAGPQMGFNTGAEISSEGTNGNNNASAVVVLKQKDIGLAYGFGFEIAVNEKRTVRLDFGYRGFNGLVKMEDNSQTQTGSYNVIGNGTRKTNAAYIGMSLLF